MTRMSKQGKRRNTSPRKHQAPCAKTGAKKDALPEGYRVHEAALDPKEFGVFIPKIK